VALAGGAENATGIPQNYGGVVILRRKILDEGVCSTAKVLLYLLFVNSVDS
jgi:hypothetical protein